VDGGVSFVPVAMTFGSISLEGIEKSGLPKTDEIRIRNIPQPLIIQLDLPIKLYNRPSQASGYCLNHDPRARWTARESPRNIRNERLMRVYPSSNREPGEGEKMLEMRVLLDQHDAEVVMEGGC